MLNFLDGETSVLQVYLVGSCVLRGCVPKKILVYGSAFAGEFEVS